jgi:type VI secretion system protein ImpK
MNPSDPFSKSGDDDRTVIRPSPGGRGRRMTSMPPAQSGRFELPENVLRQDYFNGINLLTGSAFYLLSLVPKLRTLSVYHEINNLQDRLVSEIRAFENSALQLGAPQKQVNIAGYFLCALIDETVLNTPWGSQSNWGQNSLLIQFHNEAWAGEKFFQILDRLKQQMAQNLNLLELAYLCLSLGFEGKYRIMDSGHRALDQLHRELYLLIQRIRGDFERSLSIRWKGLRGLRSPLRRQVPLWVITVVTGSLLMLIYLGFAYAINNFSDRVNKELFELARKVKQSQPRLAAEPVAFIQTSTGVDRFRKLLAGEIAQNMIAVIDGPILRISDAFPSGSDQIKNDFLPLLAKIAREVHNDTTRVLVVGHTDNIKIKFSARFPSNWHLSSARAKNVADIIKGHGLPGDRVRFEGRADGDPIAPNDTAANRARNRRVDIHIR